MAAGLLLVIFGAWVAGWGRTSPITQTGGGEATAIWGAKVDANEYYETKVRVQRRQNGEWEDFPANAEAPEAACVVDRDGHGDRIVVVGLRKVWRGYNLVAFDGGANLLWGMRLGPERHRWAGCGPPAHWLCAAVAAGDLDGEPGHELVVVASDSFSEPTRVSIVDPRTQVISESFWHRGNIHDVTVEPAFFEGKRPALLAWGINNILDEEPLPGTEHPLVQAGFVAVIMILDPATMQGQGPIRAEEVDLPLARPYAYACLNMPAATRALVNGKPPDLCETGQFQGPEDWVFPAQDYAAVPWKHVTVTSQDPEFGRVTLVVDRDLNLLDAKLIEGDPTGVDSNYWRGVWRPIIRRYEYVRDPAADGG